MAGQAAKKRLEENRRRLNLLRVLVAVGFVSQAVQLFRAGRPGLARLAGTALTTGATAMCFATIAKIAAPVYDARGELLDGGGDLNRGGINGYAHDILYVTAFVQVTTLISSWFWLALLVVPGYALFKLTQLIIIPWIRSANDDGDGGPAVDEATRKKLQRTEDRAQRRRMKNFR